MAIRLLLFGGARLERDGHRIAGKATQRRRLALLVLLARASQRTLTRERVLAYLWPDHAPDAARRLLTEAVYVIRRELGEGVIQSAGEELTLCHAVESDVDAFLAAVDSGSSDVAIELYRGPFLDGWFIRDAAEFERWAEAERVELARAHVSVLCGLAERHESSNDWARAAEVWQRILRLDPYSSTCIFRAARALASAGESAAAVQLIDAHEALLREELGVGLDVELTTLSKAIRTGLTAVRRPTPVTPLPETARSDSEITEATSRSESPAPSPPLESVQSDRQFGQRNRRIAIALLLLATLGGTWAMAGEILRSGNNATGIVARRTKAFDSHRIAVLYFHDLTADHSLGYMSDGLAEHLIRELAAVPALHVLSRDAVLRVRDAGLGADSIGRILDAGTLITASLEKSAGRIRVLAQLIDVPSNEQTKTITIEQPTGELFALEDSLAARMAGALRQRLGDVVNSHYRQQRYSGNRDNHALALVMESERLRKAAEAARIGVESPEAITDARRQLQMADSLLSVAEVLNPTWAEPPLERGWVAVEEGRLEHGTARVVALAPGLAYAERSLALLREHSLSDTAGRADALYLRGVARTETATAVQTYRPEDRLLKAGRADLDSAVLLDPSLAGAWAALSRSRWLIGDFEGAQAAAARALDADAFLANGDEVMGWAWRAAYFRADRAGAVEWCRRGRELLPNDWHFIECELTIMRLDAAHLTRTSPNPARAWSIVTLLERIDPVSRAAQEGRPYSPHYRRLVAAAVSAAAGDRDSARAVLNRELVSLHGDPELSTDVLYDAAFVYSALGERESAQRLISNYLQARPDLKPLLSRDPTARPILMESGESRHASLEGGQVLHRK
jgi:DNA-binding SARP family transcriptional activator/TolB-like protein